MEQSRRYYLHLAALIFLATGCASDPPPTERFDTSVEAPSSQSAPGATATDVATAREAAVSYANVDRYKEILARHIVLRNADRTFSGPLPPVLPAIVVLRISVDRSGAITNMFVQRSRDDEASAVAMASLRRSGALPRPHNLLKANEQDLTFSETFLFNEDYRFQVRSLALPQPLVD